MTATGWLGAGQPDEAPAGGFAGFLLAHRAQPDEGSTLEQVFERAIGPGRPPEPYDDDEQQANLLARGYAPGMISDLARQLADAQAELATVREENEKARKTQARIAGDHAAGKITAFDIARMDFGEPDVPRERKLERRAANLRRQLEETQQLISPPARRTPDRVEAASRRAHETFRQVTRARMAEARGQVPAPGPRPFASSGGAVVRNEPVTCQACLAVGATETESFLIHHMDADGRPLSAPSEVPVAVPPDDTGQRAAYEWLPCRGCGIPADRCSCRSMAVR